MDDADRATDLEEAGRSVATAKIAKELSTVNPKYECDSYHDDCSGEIGIKRKEAYPSATRCILCQSAWDKEFKGVRRL